MTYSNGFFNNGSTVMENNLVQPLQGIRVLELGQFLAGPFAATLLGYYGAEVIKIESPDGGDQIRRWRTMRNDTSLWWYSLGRNKKSVTINMKHPRGQQLVRQLAQQSDVLVENFRPGTLENWGLGPEDLKSHNPELIVARVSGYGQTGPYAGKPGYASVCEGFGGFRYINGIPGEPPVRPNLSMGDTLAGLHAAFGVLLALQQRGKSGQGQVVDVALFESVFNLLESVVPEYDGAGQIRQPSGSTITGIVPTNTYRCRDGKYVIIGGNGDSIFKRLMTAIGRADLAADPRLRSNDGRVQHEAEIDAVIEAWTAQNDAEQVLSTMEQVRVPAGPIYNVADMFQDPQYQARGLFEQVTVEDEPLAIPALVPKLGTTPGITRWPGPKLGQHNTEIFQRLSLSEDQQAELRAEGVL